MPAWRWLGAAVIAGAVGGWWLTSPTSPPAHYAELTGDPARGEITFAAAGCSSCHVAPSDKTAGPAVLAGGIAFASAFGTFYAPNISPSSAGIGAWSDADLIHAIKAGVGPGHGHLYPALPYSSYIRADPRDLADAIAYLRTLPPDPTASRAHDVGFPFNIRRALAGWKLLFLRKGWIVENAPTPELERGRYLVEALGHCGECHTPRNALGGLKRDAWLTGAANPNGEGRIPGLRPGQLDWSAADIAAYLASGFTPEFDSAGGEMAAVIRNTAKLPGSDHAAIAAYLKALPPI